MGTTAGADESCGNGVVEEGEQCDEGAANSDTESNACRTDCADHRCGDGVIDSGEQCDDGAGNADTVVDGCRSDCTPGTGASSWYTPSMSVTWQWQLQGTVNTSYDVEIYDIDLFDNSATSIASLQTAGHEVVCYFSAGSYEDWRPDTGDFLAADLGDSSGWPGESWIDIRSSNVRSIMQARLDLAASKGCDGVEPDNVDGYTNNTGFPLTAADQLDYNRFLAAEAHARGLGIGLKNDLEQAAELVSNFDFAINEECHDYDECDLLQVFIAADKPVLNAEYADTAAQASSRAVTLCPQARAEAFHTLILPWDLDDAFRVSCEQ
jgi:hypothetical protein